MKRIGAFSASNSEHSINRQLLEHVVGLMPQYQSTVIDIRKYQMPIYSVALESELGVPNVAKELLFELATYDAFIIATPEHNGSMPAVFKNCIDWISRATAPEQTIFNAKPVFLLSTSPGLNGGSTNLKNLSELMPWWGAKGVLMYSLGNFEKHFVNGILDNSRSKELLEQLRLFDILIDVH